MRRSARHPALILVDELAHTNVPGSRHPKRWQDIDELLAARHRRVHDAQRPAHREPERRRRRHHRHQRLGDGAGHLLRPGRRGGAGRHLRPTICSRALPPARSTCLSRSSAPRSNFFRKGNLMALRELALRRTADRVEDDVQAYRSDKAIERVWKTEAFAAVLHRPRTRRRRRGAQRGAPRRGSSASTGRPSYVETPALQRLSARGTRADSQDRQARAGIRREDGDSGRRRCGGGSRRVRPHAQLLEGGRRAHRADFRMAVGSRHGAAHRRVGAGHRPDRGRARRRAHRAPATRRRRRGRNRPPARRQAAALPLGTAGVPRDDARRDAVAALLRPREHRHAVPVDGGAGRA